MWPEADMWRESLLDELRHFQSAGGPTVDNQLSPDSSTVLFDLEATKICWVKVVGIECGEPSDPESETGQCSTHRAETRAEWSNE